MFLEGKIRQNTYNKNLGEEAKGEEPSVQSQSGRAVRGGAVGPPCRRWATPRMELPPRTEQRGVEGCMCENTFFYQAESVCVCVESRGRMVNYIFLEQRRLSEVAVIVNLS